MADSGIRTHYQRLPIFVVPSHIFITQPNNDSSSMNLRCQGQFPEKQKNPTIDLNIFLSKHSLTENKKSTCDFNNFCRFFNRQKIFNFYGLRDVKLQMKFFGFAVLTEIVSREFSFFGLPNRKY